MFIPDLHRLRAEALRRVDRRHEGIEQQYRLALRIAMQQGAPALELRAATGMASWLAEAARCKEADDLLRPVYDKFTEGLGTRDLKTARVLLDQLA
jgi:predicted ATPase